MAKSNLFKVGSGRGLARVAERSIMGAIGLLLNSTAGGAVPTLFAATAAEAEGGAYYGPQGFEEMRGGDVGPAFIAPAARDPEAQRRLWEACEALTGCGL